MVFSLFFQKNCEFQDSLFTRELNSVESLELLWFYVLK